ncbi:MAG: BamA/TamA family outer membrane protein, partial [Gemmatimonadota bacterium]
MPRCRHATLALTLLTLVPSPLRGQTGLELGGVPALNFDADEGFGYGVVVELYEYGDGALGPYLWTLQPTVFLTTEGRKDFTLFFDAPHLLGAWRLDAFVGSEARFATPYYGLGNSSVFDEARVTDADPYYYRFGRTRRSATVDLQHGLGAGPLRMLLGGGVVHGSSVPVPDGVGTTLLEQELAASGAPAPEGWSNYMRAGIIYDTRDRETGPRRGTWTELLVQRVDERLGSTTSYTRITLTDRRYLSAGPLTLAHRLLVQGVSQGVPLYDLNQIQTSFKQQEGLGGAKSVRGVSKNRFAGR